MRRGVPRFINAIKAAYNKNIDKAFTEDIVVGKTLKSNINTFIQGQKRFEIEEFFTLKLTTEHVVLREYRNNQLAGEENYMKYIDAEVAMSKKL